MSFRVVPKSVTLIDLKRRMALILCYFMEFGSCWANYVKVVEDTPILSAT